jgi:mono/diheme cytochrome c family protein
LKNDTEGDRCRSGYRLVAQGFVDNFDSPIVFPETDSLSRCLTEKEVRKASKCDQAVSPERSIVIRTRSGGLRMSSAACSPVVLRLSIAALLIRFVSLGSPASIGAEEIGGLNRRMPDLKAVDVGGKSVSFQNLARKGNGLVIAFHSVTCPVSKQYGPTLVRLEQSLKEKGIALAIVNPAATDPKDAIDRFRAQFSSDLLYLIDADEAIAASLRARSTTEAFLFDKALTLRYRGAVDDQFSVGAALAEPRRRWLADALAAVSAGYDVAASVTDPSGCLLDPRKPAISKSDASAVNYHDRISRIVQRHCLECHRDGGLAPFSLATYDDLKAHRAMIRREVGRGQMPPWFAEKTTDESHPGWRNDRSMPSEDKADLLAWLSAGLPEGNAADAPLPRLFPDTGGWSIGKPDRVLKLNAPIAIAAQGKMPYQIRTVETGLTEDKWLAAYEIRPTDRQAVHHVLVFLLPPIVDDDKADDRHDDERRGFFAAYVPGSSAMTFPDGYGKLVPKGSRLRFQIHYTPYGEATEDQLEIGLKWHSAKPAKELKVFGLTNPAIEIPAGAAHHVETARIKTPADVRILGFLPHMHVRGKAFEYAVEYPDGRRQVLLNVPRYDFNWQLHYELAEPVEVPAGSTLIATAVFDNSEANRANPDPSEVVRWGQQTDEEMLLGYVEYETDARFAMPGPGARIADGPIARILGGGDPDARRERLFRFLDTDRDDLLSRDELGRLERQVPRLKGQPERIDTLIRTLDDDDDGKLDRKELKNLRSLAGS